MPNTNAPFGYRPYRMLDGSPPTYGMERFFINSSDANNFGTGDLVAQSSQFPGAITLYAGSSVAPTPLGVFNGCEFFSPTVGRVVWSNNYQTGAGAASSNPVTAYVQTHPDLLYTAQVSSANITSSNNTGELLFHNSGLGINTTTGISQATISSSQGVSGLSSAPWRFIDTLANVGPPGAPGTDASSAQFFNIVVVKPNNWTYNVLTGVTS